MDKDNLKKIIKSKEWTDFEQFIRGEFDRIKVDINAPVAEIGQRALARIMAIEALDKAVSKLHRIKNEQEKKEISYK